MVSSVYDLDVYQKAYTLALKIHAVTQSFPKNEQYAMADQMRRASKGICANLAEGFAKGHKSAPEFKRYAIIAVGSAEEMKVWLDFSRDLDFIPAPEALKYREEYSVICRQINKLAYSWERRN